MSSLLQERNILLEPWFSISINGKMLDEDMLKYVEEVQVEDEEDKLPLARIRVMDPDRIWLNDKGIIKGAKITVKLGHRFNNRLLFDGRITHVEANYPETGDPTLEINAIDKAIKLMDVREARTFKNMKVSDVIKKMLKECGLEGEVQDTGAVLEHIPQEKESNLEFITRWRKKLNWRFYRKGSKYYFGKKEKNSGNKVRTLGYKTGGMEIISFQPAYQDHETTDNEKFEDIDNKKGAKTSVKVENANKKSGLSNSKSKSSKHSPIGKV